MRVSVGPKSTRAATAKGPCGSVLQAVISGEASLHRVILGGHLLHQMAEAKVPVPVDTLKPTLVQVYVKQVLQAKNKVRPHITAHCEDVCRKMLQMKYKGMCV